MIRLKQIEKTYNSGSVAFHALKGVDIHIKAGEFVSIMGPSGSGKSTLMNVIGLLDRPSGGEYLLDGAAVAGLDVDQLALIRNRKIGFIFQSFNLLPYATAGENVELPMIFHRSTTRQRRERVEELLNQVGLWQWRHHRPTELSGGQQQRVAIARALANDSPVLLADEPTGNLDSRSGGEIMELFADLWERGRTIVMVTHDDHVAACSGRVIYIRDGVVDTERSTARPPQ